MRDYEQRGSIILTVPLKPSHKPIREGQWTFTWIFSDGQNYEPMKYKIVVTLANQAGANMNKRKKRPEVYKY